MLEDLGVVASYRRGFEVLAGNLGTALILFLIQVAVSIGLFIVMIVPGFLMVLCCLLMARSDPCPRGFQCLHIHTVDPGMAGICRWKLKS